MRSRASSCPSSTGSRPEHKFPIPLDDCTAAYRWMVDHADELGVDLDRLAIGGTSAGGNLAAALCLRIRDEQLPMPLLQLLDVPALDLTMASASVTEVGDGAGLTGAALAGYVEHYLADPADATNPLVSPLLADDLSGLPPAVIIVAEHDPVRDDGERYLVRLHEAGVAAASFRVLAQFHGGWIIPSRSPRASWPTFVSRRCNAPSPARSTRSTPPPSARSRSTGDLGRFAVGNRTRSDRDRDPFSSRSDLGQGAL